MDAEAHPSGTLLAGKFRVVRVLGAGGMGVVYEVIHELTHHRRALKLLHRGCLERPETAERFLREASAAGRIRNNHIIQTFDAGQLAGGQPYLVMELLEGQTVADRIDETGGMSLEEIVDVFVQACSGVHAAHDAGIVHRDLKPENLFLVERRGRPFVKVLDFGVSMFDPRHRLSRATAEGDIIGTPYYMSPEQIRGDRDLDGRSDVYALGVILYEAATGKHPYPTDKLLTLVASVLEVTPAPLIEVRRDLPPRLSAIVEQAMMKDRERRIPTAKELGEALASLIPSWKHGDLGADSTSDASGSGSFAPPPSGELSSSDSASSLRDLAEPDRALLGSSAARAESVIPSKLDTRSSRHDAQRAPPSARDVAQQTSGPTSSDVLASPEAAVRLSQVLIAALGTLVMLTIGGLIAWRVFRSPPGEPPPTAVAITPPEAPPSSTNLPEVSPAASGHPRSDADPEPVLAPSSVPGARGPARTEPSAGATTSAAPDARPTAKTARPAPNGLARKDEFKQ